MFYIMYRFFCAENQLNILPAYTDNRRMQQRNRNIWLISRPFRYPLIPAAGMKRKTPVIRMQRLKRLNRKEQVVFPSPLIMLRSTVFVYRNGQIHASVRIKFPASGLLNRKIPIHFPSIRRTPQQKHPSKMQEQVIFKIKERSCCRSFIS